MIEASLPSTVAYPSLQTLISEVRAAAEAWFVARGLPLHPTYSHILGEEVHWRENLILPEVRAYFEGEIAAAKTGERCPFALNGGISNGVSSQALAFNLVGPLIARKDLEPLRFVLTAAGIPWPRQACAAFEVESRVVFNEQFGQPTSLDLVIGGGPADTGPICVEVKLTESGFGGCSVLADNRCDTKGANPLADLSQCYLHRKRYAYWQRLEEHDALLPAQREAAGCPLAFDYQFYRELLFALHSGGHFVLLHDARSPIFEGAPKSMLPRLRGALPANLRGRIYAITVQQVVAAIRASGRHDDWIGEFEAKYGLPRS